jgi:putative DNA primase/helicase
MDDAGFSIGDAPDDPPEGEGKARRPRRRDVIAGLLSDVILRRSPDGVAHASVRRPDGGREHMRCESKTFREWLTLRYLEATGAGISGTALGEAVNLAVARALGSGEVVRFWRRVALGDDGAVWLDLGGGDPAGERRAVRITPAGWRVMPAKDVAPCFLRAPDSLPHPEPEAGEGSAAMLGELVNVTPEDLPLLWAYIVCALRPFAEGGAYPACVLTGEQGSGKSSAARIIQALVDPSSLAGRALPREERDLFVSAQNRHLMALDNVSALTEAFADCLCRISTGGGYSARTLMTDADETLFTVLKPFLVNGIPATILSRADFAERALAIETRAIKARRTDAELAERFRRLRPALLGLACDGIASALRNLGRVVLADPPRMVDACTWAEAAAEGLGIEPGRIARAWTENRRRAEGEALATDDLAAAVCAFLEARGGRWRGAPSELARELRAEVAEAVTRSPAWPRTPAALSARLRRLAPALRRVRGIEYASGKAGADGQRFVSLARTGDDADA